MFDMNTQRSNSDSELAAWASSFSGMADAKLYQTRDPSTHPSTVATHHYQHHHRQSSQGLSSQSRSYQPSQLAFVTAAEERNAITQQLSTSMERDSSQQYTVTTTTSTATPPESHAQQPPHRAQPSPAPGSQYTASSTPTAASIAAVGKTLTTPNTMSSQARGNNYPHHHQQHLHHHSSGNVNSALSHLQMPATSELLPSTFSPYPQTQQQQLQQQQQQQQQQRSFADTIGDGSTTTKPMHSLTQSRTLNGDSQPLRHSSSHSSSLPPPAKIPPAAVAAAAAAAAATHPLFASHASAGEDGDLGGDMEVNRACLEDYLDLQDDDSSVSSRRSSTSSSSSNGKSGREGLGSVGDQNAYASNEAMRHSTHPSLTDLARSSSQHSRGNNRSSLWVTDLSDLTGNQPPPPPPPPPKQPYTAAYDARGLTASTQPRDADMAGLQLRSAALKKTQPPPLSGFAPVTAATSGSTPPDTQTNYHQHHHHHQQQHHHQHQHVVGLHAIPAFQSGPAARSPTFGNPNNTTTTTNNSGAGPTRSNPTPQPLSLGSSSKVSPSSHQSGGELAEEERRLKDELQLLRQRVAETEQRLSKVQRRLASENSPQTLTAESSMNAGVIGTATTTTASEEGGQRFPHPTTSATATMGGALYSTNAAAAAGSPPRPPSGLRGVPMDAAPGLYVLASQPPQQQQRQGSAGSGLNAPRYTLNVSPPQQQQQQQVIMSQHGTQMYLSSAPPSASVTMAHPAAAETTGLASSGVTYYVQGGGAPFGLYAVSANGTVVDAAGNALSSAPASSGAAGGAMPGLYHLAPSTAPPPPPPQQQQQQQVNTSAMQVVNGQPFMMNNQPTICYMVLAPQGQPPQQQQQQHSGTPPQQLAASGLLSASLPSPEYGSVNNLMSTAALGKGPAGLMQLPLLATTGAPTTTNPNNLSNSCCVGGRIAEVVPGYPHNIMVGPASNGELTRKCFNVHGSMLGVVQYFPYDETAAPAPTATILPANAATTLAPSPGASMLGQSMSGAGWSVRSINANTAGTTTSAAATAAEFGLAGSCRSHDGASTSAGNANTNNNNVSSATDGASQAARSAGSATPPTGKSSTPTLPSDLSTAPALPIFIQMFPCELHDRATVLNRVIEATCGRDAGVVQRIEPRSETSFIAHVRTHQVWQLIYKLRCRVLMDRFGFWYAADLDQYVRMKEYCEGVRRLPQQTRHFQTDGLPCMPLVVELSRAVDRAVVTENNAPRTFDEVIPIAAVDRHRTRLHPPSVSGAPGLPGAVVATGGSAAGYAPLMGVGPESAMAAAHLNSSTNMNASATMGSVTANNNNNNNANNFAPLMTVMGPPQRGSMMTTAAAGEMNYVNLANSLGGSARGGQSTYADPRLPAPSFM